MNWSKRILVGSAVVLLGAAAPLVGAAASTGLPRVTSITPYVSGTSTLDDVHVNWGAYSAATSYFIQTFGGAFSGGTTAPPDIVNYGSTNPPAPQSYRPVVCPSGFIWDVCGYSQLPVVTQPAGATATTVIGPWYHPAVSASISAPAPTVTVEPHIGFITGTVNVGGHSDAPVSVVYRNGVAVELLAKGQTTFTDTGPFSSDTVKYQVASCYRDCFTGALNDGFAGRSALSPGVSVPNPIFRVAPNAVVQGIPTIVAIKGYGFQPGATVSLSGAGITAGRTRFVSPLRINVEVRVAAGQTAMASDVTLTNPDGSTQSCGPCLWVFPAPTISSATPSSVAPGYDGAVGIVGTNFDTGAKISTSAAGVTILSSNSLAYNTTEVVAVISVGAAAAPGPVPLTVTNPNGGTATCAACLSIS